MSAGQWEEGEWVSGTPHPDNHVALGQVLHNGSWVDYARGTPEGVIRWAESRPEGSARVVDWIDKRTVIWPRPIKHYVVTYTSMVIDAPGEDEAISRAGDSGGGNWEAAELAATQPPRVPVDRYLVNDMLTAWLFDNDIRMEDEDLNELAHTVSDFLERKGQAFS